MLLVLDLRIAVQPPGEVRLSKVQRIGRAPPGGVLRVSWPAMTSSAAMSGIPLASRRARVRTTKSCHCGLSTSG